MIFLSAIRTSATPPLDAVSSTYFLLYTALASSISRNHAASAVLNASAAFHDHSSPLLSESMISTWLWDCSLIRIGRSLSHSPGTGTFSSELSPKGSEKSRMGAWSSLHDNSTTDRKSVV